MCASWNDNFDPDLLCAGLEEIKQVDGGTVKFDGLLHHEFVTVLPSMVVFEMNIPDRSAQRIINQATFNVARSSKITSVSLMKEMTRLESEYRSKETRRFILLSQISIPRSDQVSSIRFDKRSLTFNIHRPERFQLSDRVDERISQLGFPELGPSHIWVRVSVWARDEPEAGDKAFETLNFFRGIWNYSINRKIGMRFSSLQLVVNRILLGPYMTLHYPNGIPAGDQLWFEPEYVRPVYQGPIDWQWIKKDEKYIRSRLKNHAYADTMIDAFNLYCTALDRFNLNIAFIRLFSVLELLGRRRKGEGKKDLVKRVTSLFSDEDMAKEYLNHFYEFRNRAVHEAYSSDLVEPVLFQFKRVVERLILHHMKIPSSSQTIIETWKNLEYRA